MLFFQLKTSKMCDVTRKIIYIIILGITWTVCDCCDILHYSSVCKNEQMSISVSFEYPFTGTVFANGFNGNPNCSSPNMETTESRKVTLNIPFMQCNTTIKSIKGKRNLQAWNTFTIQFHPLIQSVQDCEVFATCDIDYPLSRDFFKRYLNRDLKPSTPVTSKLDIMSGEKLFGALLADFLYASQKQYLVLNVTDGGQHNQLRIRKCYAHARYVIDSISTPDLLLEDNQCSRGGAISWLALNADKSYSDLRDFSEVQNVDISFNQRSLYITCAFDMCADSCSYSCFGGTEIKKSNWSTVRTHKVGSFDRSFKGFSNRNADLRLSVKMLSERFLKLKKAKRVLKSNLRTPRLESTKQKFVIKDSPSFEEETFTRLDAFDTFSQLNEEISTTDPLYYADVLEDMSKLSKDQDETKYSIEDIDDVSPEIKSSERVGKRSIIEDETEYSDKTSYTIIVGAPTLSTAATSGKSNLISGIDCFNASCKSNKKANIIKKSKKHMNGTNCITTSCGSDKNADIPDKFKELNGTDCFNASCEPDRIADKPDKFKKLNSTDCFNFSCRQDVEASSILVSESSVTTNLPTRDRILKLDETTSSTLDFNFTGSNDEFFAVDDSTQKDCVPYLKFASVTSSLSVLSVFLVLLVLFFALYIRKERKRFTSHCTYMFNDY